MRWTTKLALFLLPLVALSQPADTLELGFREYLGYVKKYHPVVGQANLTIDMAQAKVMKARGGFDPKVEVDYDRKKFKGTEYFDLLNATFKIPTWFGVELKANFEQNDGEFLNPQNFVPDDGLYSAGVSVNLGRFLMDDRMATLKRAKFFREQTRADQQLLINEILYQASVAYFNWLRAYREYSVFDNILDNASQRFRAVKRSAEEGDMAVIDTVEAKIAVQNRMLGLEQARIKLFKRRLELSNFLWMEGNIPMELQENVKPSASTDQEVDLALSIDQQPLSTFNLENHPKLVSLRLKIEGLEVDKRLKANRLLPSIDVDYNFLTEEPLDGSTYLSSQYKGGIRFALPLFLRKERGDLQLAKLKLADANFELDATDLNLRNKITAIFNELDSFNEQSGMIGDIVTNYTQLLRAEERKFLFGDSSIFLINSREQKLIESQLKQIEIGYKFLDSKARLFNTLALPGENI